MANKKYSIPANYNVVTLNNLKGIMRHDKNGDKWTWDPFYSILLVGRSYGKILVAYKEAISQDQFLRISSYNKKDHVPIEAYDLMFGENCLYVRTFRKSTGDIEWCLVREDLGGGKFLGEFEFTSRDRAMPFHIPIGTTEMQIKLPDGTLKKLKLLSGDIVADDSLAHREKPKVIEEPPATHYNIMVDAENKRLKLMNAANNKLVKESTCVGEIEAYKPILEQMLGTLENVDKETGDLLVTFLAHFEHYVHGIIIPILFNYVKDRNKTASVKETLEAMIKEVSTEWFTGDNNKEFKLYTEGTIITAMSKLKNGRITVAPYMIENDEDILSVEEIQALGSLYDGNDCNTARLRIISADLDEIIKDEDELKQWPSPYSVKQRLAFASDIKQFTYNKIYMYVLNAATMTDSGDITGNVVINVALCEDFTYKPKKKIGGKASEWVKTNTSAAQII